MNAQTLADAAIYSAGDYRREADRIEAEYPRRYAAGVRMLRRAATVVERCSSRSAYTPAVNDERAAILAILTGPQALTLTHEEVIARQWRNFRRCPECGAAIGLACRKPTCPQLQDSQS